MSSAAPATRSLVIERELPHAPEKIWRALTSGPLIAQWLMNNDFLPLLGHKFQFRATPMPQWNGVIDCEVLLRLEQSGFRPDDERNYQSASFGWPRFLANLERLTAGPDC